MDTSLSDSQLAQWIIRDTLNQHPGWTDGKGISMRELQNLIDEWEDDEEEEFLDAIAALEEQGDLERQADACDEDTMIFCPLWPV